MNLRAQGYFDGCALGNPGRAGAGFVILCGETGNELARGARFLGHNVTNNEAEYQALLDLLAAAQNLKMGNVQLCIQGDSKLVIEQVKGNWRVKASNLQSAHREAKAIMEKHINWWLHWIPRERNEIADRLSKEGALKS